MRRLTCLAVILTAVPFAAACGDDGDAASASPSSDEPATSLAVVWEGNPKAGKHPFGVVLVEPADGIAAKGLVANPAHRSHLFTFARRWAIDRYTVDVRRQVCDTGDCSVYSPLGTVCTRTVNVEHGHSAEATVSRPVEKSPLCAG